MKITYRIQFHRDYHEYQEEATVTLDEATSIQELATIQEEVKANFRDKIADNQAEINRLEARQHRLQVEIKELEESLETAKRRWDKTREFIQKLGFDPETFVEDTDLPF